MSHRFHRNQTNVKCQTQRFKRCFKPSDNVSYTRHRYEWESIKTFVAHCKSQTVVPSVDCAINVTTRVVGLILAYQYIPLDPYLPICKKKLCSYLLALYSLAPYQSNDQHGPYSFVSLIHVTKVCAIIQFRLESHRRNLSVNTALILCLIRKRPHALWKPCENWLLMNWYASLFAYQL